MMLQALKRQNIPYYRQLMRTDKPIGTLLLLWPTYWALWLGANGFPSWPLLLIFSAGVFVMRSAGCVINDFADRHVDGAVERTQNRPLADKRVTEGEALSLFSLLIGVAFLLVLLLSWQTIALSFGALVLAFVYPFMKRFTQLPQVVLGAAFSWAIPMAYMATRGDVPLEAWLVFVANLSWTVGYDTLYAMVDREDDRKVGIKSTAILFGRADLLMVALLYVVFISALAYVGIERGFGVPYWSGLGVAGILMLRQLWSARGRERDKCFAAFLNNHYVGMAVFIGLSASMWMAA